MNCPSLEMLLATLHRCAYQATRIQVGHFLQWLREFTGYIELRMRSLAHSSRVPKNAARCALRLK